MCGPNLTCGDIVLQLLVIGLSNGALIALNAIGFTLIYETTRTINPDHFALIWRAQGFLREG